MKRIGSSSPIDRVAARVVSEGIHFDPQTKETDLVWDTAPPFAEKPPGLDNLVGVKNGRLTVIGYFGAKAGGRGASGQKWACRCSCGRFCIATAKALRRAENMMCPKCAFTFRMQRGIE